MANLYLARQPIFDADLTVRGYELLYRNAPGQERPDADQMTSTVLVNALLEIGLDNVVGERTAFINVTRNFLVNDSEVPLNPGRTVLEVLEHVAPDDDVLAGCQRLRDEGFRIALDDFEYTEASARLLPIADIVKIDLLAMGEEAVGTLVAKCREWPVQLVAEKVETLSQLKLCRELGFDLFQGYLLSRPLTLQQRSVDPARLSILKLLGLLIDPDVDLQAIERIVRMDVGLSYRVLRVAGNGAAHGMFRQVRTVREAVVMLGQRQLRRWVMLMLVADADDTPAEQLALAMSRARMGELIAGMVPGLGPDVGFTVGLLSALDLLLDAPMADAIASLPLDDETREGLVHGTGRLGEVIACIIGFETGTPPESLLGISHDRLVKAYVDAVSWSLINGVAIMPPTKEALEAPEPAPVASAPGAWTETRRTPSPTG
ncbi:EAL domain-containing protein [Acidothermaceae bacterium B102]|nr:EAL domain-containing protein [Acidothermaceae bacterium B102]